MGICPTKCFLRILKTFPSVAERKHVFQTSFSINHKLWQPWKWVSVFHLLGMWLTKGLKLLLALTPVEIHHCSGAKAALPTSCSQAMTKHSKGRLFPGRYGTHWMGDFGSRTSPEPCQTFLRIFLSLLSSLGCVHSNFLSSALHSKSDLHSTLQALSHSLSFLPFPLTFSEAFFFIKSCLDICFLLDLDYHMRHALWLIFNVLVPTMSLGWGGRC